MSQPVKLSEALVLDARLAGEAMERSIAGQVEYWARLGRAVDACLNGEQAMRIARQARSPAAGIVPAALAAVDAPAGAERLRDHLAGGPFPRYAPHPTAAGMLVRTAADGSRTTGRFIRRVFTPTAEA